MTTEYDHQVFEIRIDAGRRAPRAPLPIEEMLLGTLDDVEVHLTSAVVGPDITITLEGRGPEADRIAQAVRETRAAWEGVDAVHPDATATVASRAIGETHPRAG